MPRYPRLFPFNLPLLLYARARLAHNIVFLLFLFASDPKPVGDVIGSRLSESWFEVTNDKLKKRLRYQWDMSFFPWLCIWTEHKYDAVMHSGEGDQYFVSPFFLFSPFVISSFLIPL